MIDPITLPAILAAVVSALAVTVLYHYIGREYLGAAENKYWNALRVTLLSAGDSTVRQKTGFALTNTVSDTEFVATVDKDSQETAKLFADAGYLQCVLSGLKYRPPNVDPNTSSQVEFEAGSMAYAHEEYSSLNPLFAWQHYRAKTQDASLGVKRALAVLRDE